jgi:hypothetical protein
LSDTEAPEVLGFSRFWDAPENICLGVDLSKAVDIEGEKIA